MIWLVQLVFDAADPDAIIQFWGQALGYRNDLVGASPDEIARFRQEFPQFDGRGRIDDNELRRMPVYIQRVPEPKQDRNRVTLEIAAPDVERLLQLGATRVSDREFTDVEGNEFSITPADGADGETRLRSVVIDADDPDRMLAFWSSATGYEPNEAELRCDPPPLDLTWQGDHFELAASTQPLLHICGMGAANGPAPYDLAPGFKFVSGAGAKTHKNRLHVDLNSTAVDSDRERLVALGATVLQWDTDHVLADPEGNEFCLSGWPEKR